MSPTFSDLVSPLLAKAITYDTPTPIQAQSIPILKKGGDLLALAQTGTGKTAAFALSILERIDLSEKHPQAIILTPTRELAIQVAEAFATYAKHLDGFEVATVYGGQAYDRQIRALKRGAHVVVGTPGRLMDHLRQGYLKTQGIKTLVLDEADEMLNMGFVGDIEWILEQIEQEHQTALFSATMSADIKKIANKYLTNAEKIQIQASKTQPILIEQSAMIATQGEKMGALMAYLEMEDYTGILIFVRTKNAASDLAERLTGWGHKSAALHGDMVQAMRERVISRAKTGELKIIVGTDVAARGIDIDHLSHVINFDLPQEVETYIHRIGRTGRAGKQGKALFFAPKRQFGMIERIERGTGAPVTLIEKPSENAIRLRRQEKLCEQVIGLLERGKLNKDHSALERIHEAGNFSDQDISVALLHLLEKKAPKIPKAAAKKEGKGKRPFHKEKSFGKKKSFAPKKHKGFSRDSGSKPKSYGNKSKDYGNKPKDYSKKPTPSGPKKTFKRKKITLK